MYIKFAPCGLHLMVGTVRDSGRGSALRDGHRKWRVYLFRPVPDRSAAAAAGAEFGGARVRTVLLAALVLMGFSFCIFINNIFFNLDCLCSVWLAENTDTSRNLLEYVTCRKAWWEM